MANTTWTLRDAMRLSHPKGVDRAVGNYILRGEVGKDAPSVIRGAERMKIAGSLNEVLAILGEHTNLPWETIPTQFLNEVKVWKALFDNGQLNGQALLRNVTRLARIGAFKDMQFAAAYAARLTDEKMIARTRLHPMNYLNALVVHKDGQRQRGGDVWYGGYRTKDWVTSSVIAAALEKGFYLSFKYVEPAGKSTLIGLDVSGSMSSMASGLDLSCAQVGAVMGMTIARTEPAHAIMGFTSQFVDLGIDATTSLTDAMSQVQRSNFGSTDAAVPAQWALRNRVEVETFVIITDNETWSGRIKPTQALSEYRSKMGVPARQVVVALNSTGFTIADPTDAGQLDVVGGDSNLPAVIANFSAGRI